MVQTGPHLKFKKSFNINPQFSVYTANIQHTYLRWHPCSQCREAVHTGGDHIHGRVDDSC